MENTEMLLSEKRENKKFTQSWKLEDYEILTDDGYVDLEYLHETEPYEVYELKLENGYALKCADNHIVFRMINWTNNSPFEGMISGYKEEIFVKDLTSQDFLLTDDGVIQVLSVTNLGYSEKMYDFQLVEGSNKRYYTNGILSHNTEFAKQLTKYMFESEDSLIRLDMSEYMDKISSTKLIGSSAGYVGYEEGSAFLNKVRTKPYSVILLDEIEKAHPDIYNMFLQVFDDGHMTDSHGRKVSFKNTVILMTSNVGTKEVKEFGTGAGFNTKSKDDKKADNIKDKLEKELKKKFPPEFINRIDDIIYFKDLGKEEILQIIDLELVKIINRVKTIGFDITVNGKLKEHLVKVGYDPQYGARPMKRAIQRWIDDCLTDYILENNPAIGTIFHLSFDTDKEVTIVTEEVIVITTIAETKPQVEDEITVVEVKPKRSRKKKSEE